MEGTNTKVYVTNISPSASEKTVTDFFSFCGKINVLTLRTLEGGAKEAVIEFHTDAAAKTALLLTNALIVDRPITVTPCPAGRQSTTGVTGESTVSGADIKSTPPTVPDQPRTETSVIASLIAAGYSLGTDTIDQARAYDEQHGITEAFNAQTEALKEKAKEIDAQYKISETASAWGSAAYSWFGGIDQKYGISQTAASLKQTSTDAAKKVSESEAVFVAGETLGVAKDVVVGAAATLKTETSRLIDEQPYLKAASTKLQEGTEAVTKEVKGVVDETTRLIHEKDEQRKHTVGDAAPAESASSASAAAPPAESQPSTSV